MRAIAPAALSCVLAAGLAGPLGAQQGPIHVVLDFQCDPIPNFMPYNAKQNGYLTLVQDMTSLFDQLEPLGVKPSFNAVGSFFEFVVQGGTNGPGAQLVRRLYDSGRMVGSHSHREYWNASFDWPDYPWSATLDQSRDSWSDAIQAAYQAIDVCWPSGAPESKAQMVDLKEYHIPQSDAEVHQLFNEFGLHIRASKGVWPFYDWYDHHVWQPFRPRVDEPLREDLQTSFVACPVGRLVGLDATENQGQDMRAEVEKRRFLQVVVNWRHADRTQAPERVWTWGCAVKAQVMDPGSDHVVDAVDLFSWIQQNFAGRTQPGTGSQVMEFASYRDVYEDYLSWEASHPGQSHFDYPASGPDWSQYPYLRAVAEEMAGFDWTADLAFGNGIDAWRLSRGPSDAVLLWRDAGPATVDLSGIVGPVVRIVNLETGLVEGYDASAVPVDEQARWVTEFAPRLTMQGVPARGQTFTLSLHGPPGSQAWIGVSAASASLNLPYYGRLLLEPSSLSFFSVGTIPAGGTLSLPISVPNDPALSGAHAEMQGLVDQLGGASFELTINAVTIDIP